MPESKNTMQYLAQQIERLIGEQCGFFLMVYEHNTDTGRSNYVSNSNREDVVKAMKEFIAKTEGNWGTDQ